MRETHANIGSELKLCFLLRSLCVPFAIFSEYPMLSICTLRGFKSTASECLCLCKCMCICIGKNYSIYIWILFSWSLFIWLRWWNAWKQSFYTMLNMLPLHTLDPMRIFCALFTLLFVTLATISFSPLVDYIWQMLLHIEWVETCDSPNDLETFFKNSFRFSSWNFNWKFKLCKR